MEVFSTDREVFFSCMVVFFSCKGVFFSTYLDVSRVSVFYGDISISWVFLALVSFSEYK